MARDREAAFETVHDSRTPPGETVLKGVSTDNHFFDVAAVGKNGARNTMPCPRMERRTTPNRNRANSDREILVRRLWFCCVCVGVLWFFYRVPECGNIQRHMCVRIRPWERFRPVYGLDLAPQSLLNFLQEAQMAP